ncbi:UNKNOWN [Stylonychia lemnae]|uniref:Uncharacterized protein n=1 Tax=Stylonychia lemnae TaxID=5949 RepID=A0A077ZUF6_STYLE|nr:UNKNOWN [Stylonychia lemnae]|eukprot:CDW72106.1 UNKNOWN [Stylonychia lemnae]
MLINTSYVDIESANSNADDPQILKSYWDDSFNFNVLRNLGQDIDIYLKSNLLKITDDFTGWSSTSQTFIQLGDHRHALRDLNLEDNKEQIYLKAQFKLDSQYKIYERKPYSFIQMIGDIGGIINSLYLLGYLFMALFHDDLLQSSIIKSIYQIEDKFSRKNFSNNDLLPSTLSRDEENIIKYEQDKQLQYKLKRSPRKKKSSATLFYKDSNFTSFDAKLLISSQSKKIFEELSKRARFDFGLKEMIIILFSKIIICKKQRSAGDHHSKETFLKKTQIFERAKKKLANEFDALTILRTIRQFKLLTGIFLNKHQNKILQMQKKNVIDSNISDNELEEFQDNQLKSIKLKRLRTVEEFEMEQKRRNYLFGSESEIRQSLRYFQEKTILNLIDKRLLLGIIQRNVELDDDEDERNEVLKEMLEIQIMSTPQRFSQIASPQIDVSNLHQSLTGLKRRLNFSPFRNKKHDIEIEYSVSECFDSADSQSNKPPLRNKHIVLTSPNQKTFSIFDSLKPVEIANDQFQQSPQRQKSKFSKMNQSQVRSKSSTQRLDTSIHDHDQLKQLDMVASPEHIELRKKKKYYLV